VQTIGHHEAVFERALALLPGGRLALSTDDLINGECNHGGVATGRPGGRFAFMPLNADPVEAVDAQGGGPVPETGGFALLARVGSARDCDSGRIALLHRTALGRARGQVTLTAPGVAIAASDLAADGNGGLIAGWVETAPDDQRAAAASPAGDVVKLAAIAAGATTARTVTVATRDDSSSGVAVAPDRRGGILVVYADNAIVVARDVGADGTVGAPIVVSSDASLGFTFVVAGTSASGGALVAWETFTDRGRTRRVYAATRPDDTSPFSAPKLLDAHGPRLSAFTLPLHLAVNAGGRAVLQWADMAFLSEDAKPQPPGPVKAVVGDVAHGFGRVTLLAPRGFVGAVAIDDDGNAATAWTTRRGEYAATASPTSGTLGPPQRVGPAPGEVTGLVVAGGQPMIASASTSGRAGAPVDLLATRR